MPASILWRGRATEPRNRLAAPRDFDRLARLDPIDKFAQVGPWHPLD
jgi:hypothetical protein